LNSLLIATTNAGKLKEFQGLLRGHFQCEPLPAHVVAVVEDGKTYQENVLKKAKGYFELFKRPVLADDSGLELDCLNGAPGIDSAHYGGEKLTWKERWNFLFQELASLGISRPKARFRCVLCYYDGVVPPLFFEATTDGYIAQGPLGTEGFGYDPIFYSSDLGKTLGEATPSEKSLVSHRARAVKKFLDWFQDNVT
jgi:XTP/dITP diphosphohydrolase